jgi:hypothetical protein
MFNRHSHTNSKYVPQDFAVDKFIIDLLQHIMGVYAHAAVRHHF